MTLASCFSVDSCSNGLIWGAMLCAIGLVVTACSIPMLLLRIRRHHQELAVARAAKRATKRATKRSSKRGTVEPRLASA